jgi:hypothetical protein
MPTHKLTPAGRALAMAFVDYHAQFPHKQNLKAWARHVERMADASPYWRPVVLSIPADMTASGRWESITIYPTLFQNRNAPNH